MACANAAVFRAGQVAHGMLGLLQATAGVVGSLVALAALEPLLLPLALLAVVPGVLLSGRRANAHYSFAFSLTPRDRGYLASVQTAALDARAEHDLFARIRELFAARSVLLISHRFSTVRAADRIYVLDDGRIVESCSHAELMARAGVYAELYGLQASAYAG